MTIRELAEKCKDRNEQCKECEGCPYTQECNAMSEYTPSAIIELVENNEEIR